MLVIVNSAARNPGVHVSFWTTLFSGYMPRSGIAGSYGEGNGTPLLPGKPHGWRSLVGYSPWGHKESDATKRFHFHFLLSCIGEGNGNPLQRSCLENPRDGGAWWAAVFGVAQSRTLLKQLSSSSSMTLLQGNQHFSVPRTGESEGHGMLSAKARAVLRPVNRHSVQ